MKNIADKVLKLASKYQIDWENGGDAAAFVSLVMQEFAQHKWVALDYMIDNKKTFYNPDEWGSEMDTLCCREMEGINGIIEHRGKAFAVRSIVGTRGMGGMNEGSPAGVEITMLWKWK